MAMQYYEWLELEIQHEYFGGKNNVLELDFTAETIAQLRDHNVIVRPNDGNFYFFIGDTAGGGAIAGLLKALPTCSFVIRFKDPMFYNYTALPEIAQEQCVLFQHDEHSDQMATTVVARPEVVPGDTSRLLGLLHINYNRLHSQKLVLSFKSRKVFFTYIIVNNSDQNIVALEVSDTQGQFYNRLEDTVVDNGSVGSVFISKDARPLLQHFDISPAESTVIANDPRAITFGIIDVSRESPATATIFIRNDNAETRKVEIKLPYPDVSGLRKSEDYGYIVESYVYF